MVGREFIPAHTEVWQHEHLEEDCDMEYSYNAMTGKTEWHEECDMEHDFWHTHQDYYPDKWTVTVYGCVHWDKKIFEDEEHCGKSTHVISKDTYRLLEGQGKWYNVETGEISSGDF